MSKAGKSHTLGPGFPMVVRVQKTGFRTAESFEYEKLAASEVTNKLCLRYFRLLDRLEQPGLLRATIRALYSQIQFMGLERCYNDTGALLQPRERL